MVADNDVMLKTLLLLLAFSATYTTWQGAGLDQVVDALRQVRPWQNPRVKRPCFSVTYDTMAMSPSLRLLLSSHNLTFSVLINVTHDSVLLAANFYRTFILPYNITPYILVITDASASPNIEKYGIPHRIINDTGQKNPDALIAMVMIHLLHQQLKVTYIDLQIVLLKDPKSYLNKSDFDLQLFQGQKGHRYSPAILHAKPTKCCIEMIWKVIERLRILEEARKHHTLNAVADFMKTHTEISIAVLDTNIFLSGKKFFIQQEHHFFRHASILSNDVVAVNDDASSTTLRTYRLKESGLWNIDDDSYYTDPSRKFILYNNDIYFDEENTTLHSEEQALHSALAMGQILGRTTILPEFHRYSVRCHLGCRYNIDHFHNTFNNAYREHTFLHHPMVPATVKLNLSPWLLIDSSKECMNQLSLEDLNSTVIMVPQNRTHGATSSEIENWFTEYVSYSILRFRCLYNSFWYFDDPNIQKDFAKQWTKGIAEQ